MMKIYQYDIATAKNVIFVNTMQQPAHQSEHVGHRLQGTAALQG